MQKTLLRIGIPGVLIVGILLGAMPSRIDAVANTARDIKPEASIMLIDPPVATANVISIAVRGLDWGPYSERQNPKAWFVDPDDTTMYELTIARNYRDCTLTLAMRGECSDDQLFLRLEIPQDVRLKLTPKMYGLYVATEKMINAMGQFTLVANPLQKNISEPTLALSPVKGPTGTYVMLFGAGFTAKEGLNVRFDRVKVSVGGYLAPEDDGTFENIGITIPSMIERDNAKITIMPGTHTIDVVNNNPTNPRSAAAQFMVQEKIEYGTGEKKDQKELNQIEKDRKKQEQIDKEQKKLEDDQKKLEDEKAKKEKERTELQKQLAERKLKREQEELQKKLKENERKQKEQEKKLNDIAKKQDGLEKREDSLKTWFCDPELPLTFQSGCTPLKKIPVKSPYEGRPCSADMPITFQPGCIGQISALQKNLFTGRACSSDIPLVWQDGCVQPPRQEMRGEYEGKSCDPSRAITFQPGCIPPPPKQPLVESFAGKKCNPYIPHYSQIGCIE
ncbi:MAG: hypothetical protein AAB400_02075 [Patescibacteria group bacterium]